MGETRLLFYSEGLTMTGYATAIVGAGVFLLVLVHGLIRAAGSTSGDGGQEVKTVDPILPMWQVLVGLSLAGLVFLMTWVSAGDAAWQVQLVLMGLVVLACGVWVLFFYLRVFNYLGRLPMAGLLAMRLLAIESHAVS